MRTRLIAALELVLIFPAALFMAALVVRELRPLQFEPAQAAQQLVMWYAARVWTLWVLLLALPFLALITGSATLLHNWNRDLLSLQAARKLLIVVRTNLAMSLVAATTLAAAGILVIVILHMAAN